MIPILLLVILFYVSIKCAIVFVDAFLDMMYEYLDDEEMFGDERCSGQEDQTRDSD